MVGVSISEFLNKENGNKFYYYTPQVDATISTKEIAKRISKECTVAYADVLAVLQALGEDIPEYLQNGAQVKLDGIGKFRLGLKQVSAADIKELTTSNITGVKVNFRPEDELAGLKRSDFEFENVSKRKEQTIAKTAAREGKTIQIVAKN